MTLVVAKVHGSIFCQEPNDNIYILGKTTQFNNCLISKSLFIIPSQVNGNYTTRLHDKYIRVSSTINSSSILIFCTFGLKSRPMRTFSFISTSLTFYFNSGSNKIIIPASEGLQNPQLATLNLFTS